MARETLRSASMMKLSAALLALLALMPAATLSAQATDTPPRWSLAIHGGAGTLERAKMTAAQQAEYKAALQSALDAGAKVLRDGGSALDAVEAVIVLLEDDPKFNAGRGAVFTWDGKNELDASIMSGETREAGAVAGVGTVRHPVRLARAVMEDGRHVFLSGKGAEEFAAEKGLELVPSEWFATEHRRKQLEKMKSQHLSALDVEFKFGTVGAVARDRAGHLAAATSTGGMTGKRWGRIGDSPIIGAGTYADDRACAVSATGAGEYFIRAGVAHEICARVRLAGEDIKAAGDAVMKEVDALGGSGGVILVAPDGTGTWSFNTPGMYRGKASSAGDKTVAIYGDE